MGNSPWKLLQGTDGNRVRSIRVPGTTSRRQRCPRDHGVDRSLKTEETDAKASAGDVLGFAIQNGICQFKTCRGPSTAPASHAARSSDRAAKQNGHCSQRWPALSTPLLHAITGLARWLEKQQPDSSIGFGRCGDLDGEFDPGSGRTLAACLTHASRTRSRSLLRGTVANG